MLKAFNIPVEKWEESYEKAVRLGYTLEQHVTELSKIMDSAPSMKEIEDFGKAIVFDRYLYEDVAPFLMGAKSKGYKIVATTPHEKDVTIHELDLSQPIALVFGTERKGISKEIIEMADEFVKIPMYGFTESFNISVSVALALNILRDRLEKSDIRWKLNEKEQILQKIKWCKKILRSGDEMEAEFRRRLATEIH